MHAEFFFVAKILGRQMKVQVQLTTKQKMDGEEDRFSVSLQGVLLSRGDSFMLSYFQENVHHSLELFPKEKRVVMMRNWKDRQRVEYIAGIKWSVDYETELGTLPLSFATRSVDFLYEDFRAGRAEILLSYLLYQFEQLVAETELSIAILPLKG